MTKASIRLPVAIAAFVALVIAPFGPQTAAGAACPGVDRDGPWEIAKGPKFPAGEQSISDHVVAGDTFVVTNEIVVMASRDAGCSWAESFALPESASSEYPYSRSSAAITALEVIMPNPVAPTVAAVIREGVSGAARPHVAIGTFTSPQGEWRSADSGLPPAGEPEFLSDAPGDPLTAYLGIDVGGGAVDLLYATTDGGATWSLRSDIASTRPQAGISLLEVDTVNADILWAGGSGGLYASTDGGRTFAPIPEFTGEQVGPIDVFSSPGQLSRIMVYRPAEGNFQFSLNGTDWLVYGAPPGGDPTSLAHGNSAVETVTTTPEAVWLMHAPTFAWGDMEAPVGGVDDIVASPGTQVTYHGRTANSILSYRGFSGGGNVGDDEGNPVTNNVDLIKDVEDLKTVASLRQRKDTVVVPLNGEKTVPYDLSIPEARIPVDLVFLLDTSSSMAVFTAGLAEAYADIANGLVEAGLDVNFGIAEHRAYPDVFPPRLDEPNFVYRKRLEIGASGAEITGVLESLTTDGGGIYDAQLGALYSLASGEYQDVFPPGPSEHDVLAGEDMTFRGEAPIRIVILGTDEPFGDENSAGDPEGQVGPRPRPDIPTIEQVTAELNEHRVKLIGLAVGPLSELAAPDLRLVAGSTDARAAGSGVDCNGDGREDLTSGEALVCELTKEEIEKAGSLVPAIINLVEAVRPQTDVSLASSASPVVERIDPDTYEGIGVQKKQDLRFDVTFKCNLTQAGKEFRVEFEAREKDRVLDSLTTNVVCSERPDFVLPAILPPLVAIGALPLTPPPGIPEIASQANSQAQFHGAAAAAQQEQEQPQLALAHSLQAQQAQLEEAEEYAMTSYRRHSEPEYPLALGAAALLMGFAYGVAVRTRDRVQVSRVRR